MGKPLKQIVPTLLAALILAGCGGSSSGGSNSIVSSGATAVPQNQTATDGLARFNYWRTQLGLHPLSRNSQLDVAAQGHSIYQAYNDVITHDQTEGKPHFTGICLANDVTDPNCDPNKPSRLDNAGYSLPSDNYAVGEVISKTVSTSGTEAADALVNAIYHRFVVLEPMFKEAGVGAATSGSGYTYLTCDMAAIGLDSGIGFGNIITFPKNGQQNVPTSFSSDSEIPDPVPSKDVVGYPVSVHADIIYVINVSSFSIQPHGGAPLPVQKLWPGVDPATGSSEAAIIPLNPLQPATTYDVQFSGTMVNYGKDANGNPIVLESQPLNASWSFTTQ